MGREHTYRIEVAWTGNLGAGTADYRAYSRDHEVRGNGKCAAIPGSSDPAFRGDGARFNPEELLVASLASCHMLWVLHLCADSGVVVTAYADEATGTMAGERFVEVVLRPRMAITDAGRLEEARRLHDRAHELCFIARSVNFAVRHEALVSASMSRR